MVTTAVKIPSTSTPSVVVGPTRSSHARRANLRASLKCRYSLRPGGRPDPNARVDPHFGAVNALTAPKRGGFQELDVPARVLEPWSPTLSFSISSFILAEPRNLAGPTVAWPTLRVAKWPLDRMPAHLWQRRHRRTGYSCTSRRRAFFGQPLKPPPIQSVPAWETAISINLDLLAPKLSPAQLCDARGLFSVPSDG